MPSADELEKAFANFDVEGSGSLSADEFVNILTREGGGAALTVDEAKALIASVDANGDGELQLEEFVALMATPGSLSLLSSPPATAEERLRNFEAETSSLKKSSPVVALCKQVANADPSVTEVKLNMAENDNALNMEFKTWPAVRKAAAIALMTDNKNIKLINLSGCSLTDKVARSLAAVMSAPGCAVEKLILERNSLCEPGLLELFAALKQNTSLSELRLEQQANTLTTKVEQEMAELVATKEGIVKINPPCRNANERRKLEAALSKNMDALRKKRNAAKQVQA
jgi:hypothetical protein